MRNGYAHLLDAPTPGPCAPASKSATFQTTDPGAPLGAAGDDRHTHNAHAEPAHDTQVLQDPQPRRSREDMILRFVVDLAVPWTNNQAEYDARPVKIQ